MSVLVIRALQFGVYGIGPLIFGELPFGVSELQNGLSLIVVYEAMPKRSQETVFFRNLDACSQERSMNQLSRMLGCIQIVAV